MENIKILQERKGIENGWVVRADTERFGKNEIMFEGSYDECNRYVNRLFSDPRVESVTTYINGYFPEYGFYLDGYHYPAPERL